ncbi:MAG: hypothetical protein EBT04_05905 [Betaproteobacteria bacterium]|nr:hypothetical protein [Betaproteobacteria bacterium]
MALGRLQDSEVYYDPVNIRQTVSLLNKTPHLWRVWTIQSWDAPTAVGARSDRSQYEYDCSTNRFRVLQQASYAGPMADGMRLAKMANPSDWMGVTPNTAPARLRDIVCH